MCSKLFDAQLSAGHVSMVQMASWWTPNSNAIGVLSTRLLRYAHLAAEPLAKAAIFGCRFSILSSVIDLFANAGEQQAGLQTVHWEPSMYHDLLRSGNGTPEGIIISYFNTVTGPFSTH